MEFNEEKALDLIQKFNLDEKTIRVWRTRGKIPDRYNKLNPDDLPEKVYAPDLEQKRMQKRLINPKINFVKVARDSKVDRVRIDGARTGRTKLYEAEMKALDIVLKKAKVDVANLLTKITTSTIPPLTKLRDCVFLLDTGILVPKLVFGDQDLVTRIKRAVANTSPGIIAKSDFEKIAQSLIELRLELS